MYYGLEAVVEKESKMKSASQKSVEPNVADLVNGWLKSYGLDYKLEQEPLNPQIDKALEEYYSKSGGDGGNRPDAKLLLRDTNLYDWPILIEYKGYKDSCGLVGDTLEFVDKSLNGIFF